MSDILKEALTWFSKNDGCAYHNPPVPKDCPTCAGWILARAVREFQKDVRIQALMAEREARMKAEKERDDYREIAENCCKPTMAALVRAEKALETIAMIAKPGSLEKTTAEEALIPRQEKL